MIHWIGRQIICRALGHKISDCIEDSFFLVTSQQWTVKCDRCNVPLLLEKDPDEPENYFITEDP